MDRGVVEPVGAQDLDVLTFHIVLMECELLRICAERTIGFIKVGVTPTAADRVHKGVRSRVGGEDLRDLFPEVVRVRLSSVEAIVQLGRDDGEHLSSPPGERRGPEHDGAVQP